MKSVFLDTDTLGPDDIDLAPLTDQLPELKFFSSTQDDQIAARVAQAEVVLVNKVRLSADTINAAKNLQLICLAATGTDNVDLDAATEAGIVVSNIRNYCAPSVVQHVFTLILALTQNLGDYRQAVRDGAWDADRPFCLLDFPIRELDGKTIGIVGFGSLGTAVGRVAETVCTFWLHVDPTTRPLPKVRLGQRVWSVSASAGCSTRRRSSVCTAR